MESSTPSTVKTPPTMAHSLVTKCRMGMRIRDASIMKGDSSYTKKMPGSTASWGCSKTTRDDDKVTTIRLKIEQQSTTILVDNKVWS